MVVEEVKAEATTNGDKKEEVTEEVKAEGEEEIEGDEAEGEEAEGEELGEEELDEEAEQKLLEGEEETEEKEGEAEETKEVKEEDKTETKEETEEEKKVAEEAKKAKAAAEKKQADEKRKTYIPSAGKYNQDEHVYMRLRSVVVGPLELEDLQKELVQDMANKSEEFFYRFHFIEKEEKHVGHIEFRFKSITEADKMIETLKTIKEGVVVKRLVGGMNAAKFDKDVRGINDESEKGRPHEKYKRIVAVGGVPESATMEKLQEVFPDARVKFIALKPDGTPKWYAYLELADEEAAKKFAEGHKEVEYEGEKLYCRSLRPGKPEDADIDPDHVMSEEERRKLQARINTMKYKLNGGAVLRPLDAQRLRRRVSQLQSLLRANQKRKGGAGDQPEGAPAAAANKTPNKTPQAGNNNQAGNRRGGGRGGGIRGGMRGGRGGNQGGVMRGGRFGPGGPNRNMGGPGFHGNMQQQGMQSPMVSPRQQGFYGAGRGRSPAANQGQVAPQQQQQQQGGRQGGNNMYNNPRRTANAVNMLVGLTNLLSQARNQGGSQGGSGSQRGSGNQGSARNQNQGNFNNQSGNQGGNQGGNFGGNGGGGGFNDGGNYAGGNSQGNGFNQGGGFGGGNQGGFNNNQGGGFGGNQGGNFGGNQGGNFNNQGGNRKRPFTGNRRGQGPNNKQARRFSGNWN